jgi:glycosyltransferase involved in cell wall biosynthesis
LDKELVSVIIPAFNAAGDIRQTLTSVLAQTYQAFEVIVVDDGSSDATGAIVQEFVAKDARFQLIRQSNAGVGAARNTAIRKARGKYIAPLDADDFWFPEKLEQQVACMERGGDDTGLVYCWSALIDKHGESMALGYPQTAEGRLRHALILRNLVENSSVPLIRAAVFEKVGLYLTWAEQGGAQGCEDWDLYLRIAEGFSIRIVPEYLVAYRQTSSSMSAKIDGMAASFTVVIHRARQRNRDLPSAAFRWSAGYFYLYLVRKGYRWGHYPGCLRYLKEAVLANPVLLLKTTVYRIFMKSFFGIAVDWIGSPFPKEVRPLPEEKERKANLSSKKKKKRPFISNRIFKRIELSRWSAALHEGA